MNQHTRIKPSRHGLHAALALTILCVTMSAETEAETSGPQSIYESPDRNVTIRLDESEMIRTIPKHFLGINSSYFNDTDAIWKEFEIPEKLLHAGIGAMRFPGGEETSYYHWQYPGVNGYEDIWDDPSKFGNAVGRGQFQVTWVHPDEWHTNEAFLDFDEFIARCVKLRIEPVVGINMSSGRKHDRIEDGVREALEWLRYCKEQGYRVKYWYLDNEPWHHNANYTFDIVNEYGPDVLRYGKAIKKEFPEVKLIVNPLAWGNSRQTEHLKQFLATAGPVIDYIDLHYYWAWGLGSWDYWLQSTPLTDRDKWTKEAGHKSIGEICDAIRAACRELELNDVGIMFLEWNIGPTEETSILSESALALIHSQYIMELVEADVEMTCLWPLLWRSEREVWPEQDRFPSIIRQSEPYEFTATAEAFAFFSNLVGNQRIAAQSNRNDVLVLATRDLAEGVTHTVVLNKRPIRQQLTIHAGENAITKVDAFALDLVHAKPYAADTETNGIAGTTTKLYLAPYSLSYIQISTQPEEN